jgi:hypothetical protein
MERPSAFLIGCQKTASTWIYKSLQEHPDINVANNDAVHFFTINYYKGFDWYESLFEQKKGAKVTIDTTPSYYRSIVVPERIKNYTNAPKFIISLRNPIDRAFSHYWHEKKKGTIKHSFEDAVFYSEFGNYDLYSNWIESGYYYYWIKNFLKYFDKEQFLFLKYEDLNVNSKSFINQIFDFLEVDKNFEPTTLSKKINKAGVGQYVQQDNSKIIGDKLNDKIYKTEYELGMKPEIRDVLNSIYREENEKLEELLGIDLSDWR